ncbi:MAG TPA: DUF465 domain-containing protein [bacterium]|nr:DUF465 domain-containing protein [bacterium]
MQQYKVVPAQEIEKRLHRTVKEHETLGEQVDELSRKEVITPEDEMELKRLRKLKLYKKDMIAYLKSMLQGGAKPE